MTAMLGAMLLVLLTWAVLAPALAGLGWMARRTWGGHGNQGIEDVLLSFWVGFAAAIGFLQLWNFVLPVNFVALLALVAAGWIAVALALWTRSHREAAENRHGFPARRLEMVLAALLALWLANRAIGPGDAHDSGLYHYTAIRWANEHPIVPGVANLSAPLALNNASFLYNAVLNTGPWADRGQHVANGLLLLALFLQILLHVSRLRRAGRNGVAAREDGPASVMNVMFLPAAVMLALAKDVASPKTDLPAGVVVLIASALAFDSLLAMKAPAADQTAQHRERDRLLCLVTLCATAVCLKLSLAVMVALLACVVLVAWLTTRRPARGAVSFVVARSGLVALLLVGSWIARNVVLSGYPLYPSRAVALPVTWRAPESHVDFLQDAIRNHAKGGLTLFVYDSVSRSKLRWYAPLMKPPFDDRDEVRGANWVRAWFFALPFTSLAEVVVPGAVAVGAWGWWLLRGRLQSSPGSGARVAAWVILPAVAGIGFWIVAGPDPRYGWPAAWVLAAASVAVVARTGSARVGRLTLLLAAVCVVPVVAYRAGVLLVLRHANPLTEIPFHPPGPDFGFHPKPAGKMASVRTRWGTEVFVPADPGSTYCWDGPLPRTGWPPLDRDLRLRDPGDLSAGFVIDRTR